MCRLDEFMAGFNSISMKLKEMYQVGCVLLSTCINVQEMKWSQID